MFSCRTVTAFVGVIALSLISGSLTASGATAAPTTTTPITDLLAENPLPGFSIDTSADSINGPVDLADAFGAPAALANDFDEILVEGRTWSNPEGAIAVLMVIDAGNFAEAGQVVIGAFQSTPASNRQSFATGIPGARVGTIDGATTDSYMVTWRQGRYANITFNSSPEANTQQLAIMLAQAQVRHLQTSTGFAPTNAPLERKRSTARQLGRIFVYALMLIVLAILIAVPFLIAAQRRRHRERQPMPTIGWPNGYAPAMPPPPTPPPPPPGAAD